jgi:hypothetical protein
MPAAREVFMILKRQSMLLRDVLDMQEYLMKKIYMLARGGEMPMGRR